MIFYIRDSRTRDWRDYPSDILHLICQIVPQPKSWNNYFTKKILNVINKMGCVFPRHKVCMDFLLKIMDLCRITQASCCIKVKIWMSHNKKSSTYFDIWVVPYALTWRKKTLKLGSSLPNIFLTIDRFWYASFYASWF